MTVTNAAGYHSNDTIPVISSDTAAVAPRRGAPRRRSVDRDPTGPHLLIGLTDRVEASGVTISVTSPTGQNTALLVDLPINGR